MIPRRTKERLIQGIFFVIAAFSVVIIFFIFGFLFWESWHAIDNVGWDLLSTDWSVRGEQFGLLSGLFGTVMVAFIAIAISLPLGLGASIYVSELAPERARLILKPTIELLAGVPSIVYGFIGVVLLGAWLQTTFESNIESILSGGLILSVMALPIIVSLSDDALKSVPKDIKEASLALGATKWQTTKNVTIPSAISGISSAVIMGLGRAIGETMAVMLVVGSVMRVPTPFYDVFETGSTLTSLIAQQMDEAPVGSVHVSVLFTAGVMLFVVVMVMSIVSDILQTRTKRKFEGKE